MARPLREPELQHTSTGLSAGSSPMRFSSSPAGMFLALGRWPGGELGRLANVEHDRVRVVDQPGRAQRVERRARAAALHDRPEQH